MSRERKEVRRMPIDLDSFRERHPQITEMWEVIGTWIIHIQDCPIKLQIKVKKYHSGRRPYVGFANYGIKGPNQHSAYWSVRNCPSVEEALEDALNGFLAYWNPENVEETEFEPSKDW